MSWVTFIWALVFGACVTMVLPHLLIGLTRRAWENLFFVLAVVSVGGTTAVDRRSAEVRSKTAAIGPGS